MPERADLAPNPVFATARAHAQGSRIGRHAHRRAQLIVLAQGALRLECDDRVLTVPPGQAAFLPGALPHAAAYGERSVVSIAYFEPADFPGLPREGLLFPASDLIRALIARALELSAAPAWSEADRRAMQVLADEIARAVEWLAAGHPVTQIAYDLGYASPSGFTAMFTRETGAPPQGWLARKGRAHAG